MDEQMLLATPLAAELFESVRELPVIDWHNHLPAAELKANQPYANLTRLWISGDPYKHRAMRILGIDERLITGPADDYQKFEAWSRAVGQLAGNPLFDWTQLELKRVFGIDELLTPENAKAVWEKANAMLPDLTPRKLLEKFNVEYAAPCVGFFEDTAAFPASGSIAPSLRADDLTALNDNTRNVLAAAGVNTLDELKKLISRRTEELTRLGCRFSDHAIDGGFVYCRDDGKNPARFAAFMQGKISPDDHAALVSALLRLLLGIYSQCRWCCQLHLGALRHTSSRLRRIAGPAGGYAGIASDIDSAAVAALLDDVEASAAGLPRMILYPLNPAANSALAILSGSFPGDRVRGKLTLGPAWWFCDHRQGMTENFEIQAAYGVLSCFCGMTTDSRSFLSFVRHEYFRRCFAAYVSDRVSRKEFPEDRTILIDLMKNVSYDNAKEMLK